MAFCKRLSLVVGLALFMGLSHAGEEGFTLVNKTGVEIHKVFIGPSTDESWGKDILGEDTLPAGKRVEIEFKGDEEVELWDIKIEDEDENSIIWTELKLSEIETLTLYYDAETEKATAKGE